MENHRRHRLPVVLNDPLPGDSAKSSRLKKELPDIPPLRYKQLHLLLTDKHKHAKKQEIIKIAAAEKDQKSVCFQFIYLIDYYSTNHRSMLRVTEEKFTPILKTCRRSLAKGSAYCLSSIWRNASSAVPFSLNSIT